MLEQMENAAAILGCEGECDNEYIFYVTIVLECINLHYRYLYINV